VLFIIEGTDLSGKSTFINMLQTHLPEMHKIHFVAPKPKEDPYVQYEHAIIDALAEHEHVVCDRSHWSEPVYASLFGRKDRLGIAGWRHVELFLSRYNAQVIYLKPSDVELRRRYAARGDDLVTMDQMFKARDNYEMCFARTALPFTQISKTSLTLARVVIERGTLFGRMFPRNVFPDPYYVGPPQPQVLLFGDRRNAKTDQLAFVPRRATSGRYLLEALSDDLWKHVGLTNACEPDRTPADLVDIVKSRQASVIALGQNASMNLRIAGIPHAAVPHPQYVRRFLHDKRIDYGRLIEGSVGTYDDHLKWKGE
jgi:thymidylate kinase